MNDYEKSESWETQAILYLILGFLLAHFSEGFVVFLGQVSIGYGIFTLITSIVLKAIYSIKLRKKKGGE